MSIFLSLATEKASLTTCAPFLTIADARLVSLSATVEMRIALPARRRISSALRLSTSQTPLPTVPMPSRPTLMGFIAFQPELQVALHVRPFGGEHAVQDGVADGAVAARRMVADHAVFFRAERLDRALRAEIEVVGAQADHAAVELLEAIAKQKQLARVVDGRPLAALRVPGVADLDAIGRGEDVVVARAADDRVALELAHHPGQHVAVLLALQRRVDVGARLAGRGDRGEKKLPEPAVLRRSVEVFLVRFAQGLEPDAVAFQRRGDNLDQAAPFRSPSFLNMSRMPRTAWRRRCSFSISAMRTCVSP